jgi:hypothetical protein
MTNNYLGVPLLSTISSNMFLSKPTPYAEETTGDYRCGLQRYIPTVAQNVFIRQILEKKFSEAGSFVQHSC